VSQIRLADLEELQARWMQSRSEASNANLYTVRLRRLWEYLFRRGLVKDDLTLDLHTPPVKESDIAVPLEPEQMISVLQHCRGAEEKAFVLFLRYSGLRIGDAIKHRTSSLNETGKLILRTTKTDKLVSVMLPEVVIEALKSCPRASLQNWFWDGRQPLRDVRSKWYRRLKKLFKRAGVPTAHPHSLRDTFAVEYLLSGMEIKNVSELLGHASIATTEKHYLSWVFRRQSRLDDQVQKAWAFDAVLNSIGGTKLVHGDAKLQ
jgi:integrase